MTGAPGHFLAFDRGWFRRHQRGLLWLANHWLTRRWFRWVLRIRKDDTGYHGRFVRLEPSCYHVAGARPGEYVADVRTHAKFAKRLYHAFAPLWWTLHFWDWLIADRWAPELSFGFLTLTAFPDTGNPGATTVDGWVMHIDAGSSSSWATLIAAAGTNVQATGTDEDYVLFRSGPTTNQWNRLARSIFHFDTSGLGGSASISAAIFSFRGTLKYDNLGVTPDTNVYASTVTSNTTLAASDFPNVGGTPYSDTAVTYSAFSTTGYNDYTLNATGIAAIALTGVTKLAVRNANYDVAATTPTWGNTLDSGFGGNFADTAGTASDPKLVVTYTTGGGGGGSGVSYYYNLMQSWFTAAGLLLGALLT